MHPLIVCAGILSGCKAEEVQTTAWEGDEPTTTDSVLKIPSDSEPPYVEITTETHPEHRSKRQTDDTNSYMLFSNREFLVQIFLNKTFRNVIRLPSGANAIGCDYDIR